MCGRTACSLQPDEICKFCSYTNASGRAVNPKWIDQQLYSPTFNLGPTKYAPVITREKDDEDRVIRSIRWGLHTRNSSSATSIVINARAETLLEKPTFKLPFQQGKRCVVVADGYFEWRRKGTLKEPYFIHLPRGISGGTETPKLLAIAGLYDTIKGGEHGFVVITVIASNTVSHIHDRMPAILEGEEEIKNWLESDRHEEIVNALKPNDRVEFYQVSSFVNSIKNDSPKCLQPQSQARERQMMENWLKGPESKPKRLKTE